MFSKDWKIQSASGVISSGGPLDPQPRGYRGLVLHMMSRKVAERDLGSTVVMILAVETFVISITANIWL